MSSPLVRAVALLVRSAPVAVPLQLVLRAADGLSGPLVFAMLGVLVDRLPAAAAQPERLVAPVAAIGAVFVAFETANALYMLVFLRIAERFRAALEEGLMRAVGSLPGLHHHEDASSADLIEVAGWAAQGPEELSERAADNVLWVAALAGSAVVVSRAGWWTVALIVVSVVPGAVHEWRTTGAETWTRIEGATELRRADYFRDLALRRDAAKELRLFGAGTWVARRQEEAWRLGLGPTLALLRTEVRRGLGLSSFKLAGAAVPVLVAGRATFAGRMSTGTFAACVLATASLVQAAEGLTVGASYLRRAGRFVPSYFRLVDLARTDPRLEVRSDSPPDLRAASEVRFESVRFAYPGTGRRVLDGVDLVLRAGESVALVGENGSGKSTLVKLLCRFYDPDDGRIMVDGVDIRDLDLDAHRSRVAVDFQDFVRYPFSFADNVSYGRRARDAVERAGALELAERVGWDALLQRDLGGVDLSGGEWQRVALARCLAVPDASILVLDEPTAALDVRVEHELYVRFASVTAGRTTLLISHRFSTVRMASRVAVLERGRIVEEGTHRELVALRGRYAALYDLQARRFT